jgi:hypothetical protein
VWTPKLYLLNSATEDMSLRIEDESDLETFHFFTGTVLYSEYGLATTKCDANVFHYPFDEHSCDIDIYSGYSDDYMIVKVVDYQYTLPTDNNKEWKIIGISKKNATFSSKVTYSRVIFTIHFQRKPAFLNLNILVPIIGLGVMNPIVFVLPESSGERMSVAVTILLALVFFLTMVTDRLPPISDPISMLNITIMTQVGNSILILIATILTMIVFEKSEKNASVPIRVQKLMMFLKCFSKPAHDWNVDRVERRKRDSQDESLSTNTHSDIIDRFENKEDINEKNQLKTVNLVTWKDVGKAINQICLTIFAFLIILNWFLYLIVIV